jgi:hypothetical protein
MFYTSLNCTLQFPAMLGEDPEHQVDSAVYLENPLDNDIQQDFSKSNCDPVLHWAAEYGVDDELVDPCCFKRVVKSMVVGLLQRRSLGFPNHFVFGMTQLGNTIQIFVGHWVLKQTVLESQDTAQRRADNAPNAQEAELHGSTAALVNEDGERSTNRRKVYGEASAETMPKDDDSQVRDKLSRSLLQIHNHLTDQDLLSR